MTREIVRGLPQSGKITFPSSLKQVCTLIVILLYAFVLMDK